MKRDSELSKLNKVAERINESTANTVIDSVRRWQVSIFVDCQTEVGSGLKMQRECSCAPTAHLSETVSGEIREHMYESRF